jgi:hypothetical protein
MLRYFWVFLLAGGLFWRPAGVRAEETYTIKVKESAKGDRAQLESEETEQSHVKVLDADGKRIEEKDEKKTTVLKYRQTILELPDPKKRPTRLRRQYDKAQLTTTDRDPQTLPYEGKAVLVEKKAGKYRFRIEGGDELTGKDAELLDKEFNKEKDDKSELENLLLPKKAVRLNEAWKIDPEGLKALGKGDEEELPVDLNKAAGTGKLVRAYQKDGHQFGVIEFRIDLPLKGVVGKEKMSLASGAKMTLQIKLDSCIDGQLSDTTADFSAKLDLTGTVKGPGGDEYKVMLKVNATQKTAQKDLPKE